MKILPKSLGAVVRRGDYFVVSNTRSGNTVQFSPDGEPGAEILGSFGAANGNILYWDADTTHMRIATSAGGDVAIYEHQCCQEAEQEIGIVRARPEPGEYSPMGLLEKYLYSADGVVSDFSGTVPELLRLIGAHGVSQHGRSKFLKELLSKFPTLINVTGVARSGRNGGKAIQCFWSRLPGCTDTKVKF